MKDAWIFRKLRGLMEMINLRRFVCEVAGVFNLLKFVRSRNLCYWFSWKLKACSKYFETSYCKAPLKRFQITMWHMGVLRERIVSSSFSQRFLSINMFYSLFKIPSNVATAIIGVNIILNCPTWKGLQYICHLSPWPQKNVTMAHIRCHKNYLFWLTEIRGCKKNWQIILTKESFNSLSKCDPYRFMTSGSSIVKYDSLSVPVSLYSQLEVGAKSSNEIWRFILLHFPFFSQKYEWQNVLLRILKANDNLKPTFFPWGVGAFKTITKAPSTLIIRNVQPCAFPPDGTLWIYFHPNSLPLERTWMFATHTHSRIPKTTVLFYSRCTNLNADRWKLQSSVVMVRL